MASRTFSGAKDTVRMCSSYGGVAKLVLLTPDLESTISGVQRNGEQGDAGLRSLEQVTFERRRTVTNEEVCLGPPLENT